MTIREILKIRSRVDLFPKLMNVEREAEKILQYVQFSDYVDHGIQHCKDVEDKLDKLVPSEALALLEAKELFFLLCSVFLHDIGMLPRNDETLSVTRNLHNERSRNYINKYWKALSIANAKDAEIIADICYAHRDFYKEGIPVYTLNEIQEKYYSSSNPRVPELAALLRIADELSLSYTRAPAIVMDVYFQKEVEERRKHWRIHRMVHNIDINQRFWRITVNPIWEKIQVKEMMRYKRYFGEFCDKVNHELEICSPFLKNKNLPEDLQLGYATITVNEVLFRNSLQNQQQEIGKIIKNELVQGAKWLMSFIERWGTTKETLWRVANTCEGIWGCLSSPNFVSFQEQILETLKRLLESQNPDGGFPSLSFKRKSTSFCTSMVLYTLSQIKNRLSVPQETKTKINAKINDCINWLKKNIDDNMWGNWKEEPLRIYTTIWALRALYFAGEKEEQYFSNALSKFVQSCVTDKGGIYGFSHESDIPAICNTTFALILFAEIGYDCFDGILSKDQYQEFRRNAINFLLKNRDKTGLWRKEEEVYYIHEQTFLNSEGERPKYPWGHFNAPRVIEALILNIGLLSPDEEGTLKESVLSLLSLQTEKGYFKETEDTKEDELKAKSYVTAYALIALKKAAALF
jgi:hypothetical protein